MTIASSNLLLGPPSTGKSSFLRSALKALGSGAVVLAPGLDELNSYTELVGKPGYRFQGFDDSEFQPLFRDWKVNGLKDAIAFARSVKAELEDDKAQGRELRYKVFGVDTFTAIARLGLNYTMAKYQLDGLPAARSPEGASFYGTLQQALDSFMRPVRAIHGMGVHLIATGHVVEREQVSEAAVASAGAKMILPAVVGGYRDILPSFFDQVFHTVVIKNPQGVTTFALQWKPSMKRATRSRMGGLAASDFIVNDWTALQEKLGKALEERSK